MLKTLPGKKIHFIGIKGAGMAPLAKLLKEMGYEVSGSDTLEQFPTDKILADAKIIATEFNVQNLENKPDLVVISAAYSKENPEIKEAYKKRLTIKLYSEVLGIISKNYQTIAVAGIHGKTTTAALISFLLKRANFDPTYLVGAGEIFPLGSSAHVGKGDYFVLEADEYRKSFEDPSPKFLDLSSQIEIITSIEMDHPDIYLSDENIYNAFYKFACHLPRNGFIVLNTDYPKAKKLQRSLVDREIVSYGLEKASFQIINFTENPTETTFMLVHKGENLGPFRLAVPGLANVLNATAAIITCRHLGIEEKIIKKYLSQFLGVKRRFEKIGQVDEILIYDDYAHHPRAIRMTLEAVRQKFPDFKIIAIFQPHTYSRTKALLNDFAQSFKIADKVIITDIYSSREKEKTISGFELSQEVKRHQRSVKFISEREKIVQEILDSASGKTLIITIGAGDVYKIALEIFESLKNEKSQNN